MEFKDNLSEQSEVYEHIKELGQEMDECSKAFHVASDMLVKARNHYGTIYGQLWAGLTAGDWIEVQGQRYEIVRLYCFVDGSEIILAADCDHLNEQNETSLFALLERVVLKTGEYRKIAKEKPSD